MHSKLIARYMRRYADLHINKAKQLQWLTEKIIMLIWLHDRHTNHVRSHAVDWFDTHMHIGIWVGVVPLITHTHGFSCTFKRNILLIAARCDGWALKIDWYPSDRCWSKLMPSAPHASFRNTLSLIDRSNALGVEDHHMCAPSRPNGCRTISGLFGLFHRTCLFDVHCRLRGQFYVMGAIVNWVLTNWNQGCVWRSTNTIFWRSDWSSSWRSKPAGRSSCLCQEWMTIECDNKKHIRALYTPALIRLVFLLRFGILVFGIMFCIKRAYLIHSKRDKVRQLHS